jgi:plasmid stabilization system protein ParE
VSRPLPLRIVRRARDEIRGAVAWWEANRPQAPDALRHDLRQALILLREQPLLGTAVADPDLPGVRRLHLARLRFYLYYRFRSSPPCVEVLALWHSSRGSGPEP